MFDFDKNFSIKGKWALDPKGLDNNGLFGVLDYSKNYGISLTVEGSLFNTMTIHTSKQHFDISILYGTTEDQKYITLLNASGNELGTNDWIYTKLTIEYALSCKSPYFAHTEMGIHQLNFNLNSFPSFLHRTSRNLRLSEHSDQAVRFTYDQPPEISLFKNDIIDVYFYFSYTFKGLASAEAFQFSNDVFINFKFAKSSQLFESISNLKFYKDFFTFFTYRKIAFNRVIFFGKSDDSELIEFKLLFKEDSAEVGESIPIFDTLLHYNEVEDVFPKMLEVWLNDQQTINSGLALFMQTKYFKFPSHIQSFLNLVFAVETLHNTYFYDKKLFFKTRLRDLIDRNFDLVVDFIYNTEDFCERVKKQRNYLAHDHSKFSESAIPEKYYPYFISTLKMIYECTFLKILNLDDTRIGTYLRKHFVYEKNKMNVLELRQQLL